MMKTLRNKVAALLAAAVLAILAIVPACGALADSDTDDTREDVYENLAGGWTVNEDDPTVIPEEVQKAFDTAMQGFVGSSMEPVAYLGSQVVSGTNYCLLCKCTLVTPDAPVYYAVVRVYADLNGGAQITAVDTVELGD